jgi:putative membrane protein
MGTVTVRLGVSPATVAFITQIYDKLLQALRAFDQDAIRMLFQGRLRDFWKRIDGNFLAVLLGGIVSGFWGVAWLMTSLLEQYPIQVWSFFFGIILISSALVLREIKKWNINIVITFLLGIILAYSITILPPATLPDNLFFAFVSGILAFFGMALPGVSGTSVLLLIGKYQYIINAMISFNIPVIALFITGAFAGIAIFLKFLVPLMENYSNSAIALLAGLTLGSLNKVWPWREVLEYITDSNGGQVPVFDKSILPWHYVTITDKDPLVFQAIFMMALGVFIVVFTEKVAAWLKTKN